MTKTILITGSTDGIGLEASLRIAGQGHRVILHGRNADKLATIKETHSVLSDCASYPADLSDVSQVKNLADAIIEQERKIDVLINNAGVFHTSGPETAHGLDIRFIVNTISPYLLSQKLLTVIPKSGRIINLSSAAQAPVSEQALTGQKSLSVGEAYAQSKLAITMWSRHIAEKLNDGPAVIAVNPGSFLGTKMVKQGYGMDGKDISIGAEILADLALAEEYDQASGQYFDNDSGRFSSPHQDALSAEKNSKLVSLIQQTLAKVSEKEKQ